MTTPLTGTLTALRPRACLPPLWRELPAVLSTTTARSVTQAPRSAGAGGPVLLIPGWLSGDLTLARLEHHLRAAGHATARSGITCNVDCSEAAVTRLVARVAALADARGERVALVGHSRGGLFARVIAVRRPDLVGGVVTLGAPHRDQLALHPLLWAQALAVALLGSAGVSGLARTQCAAGPCCSAFRDDLVAAWPAAVGRLSIYSRRDGVVDWRACLDGDGRHAEVHAAHCAMVLDPAVWRLVDATLRGFGPAPVRCPRPTARAVAGILADAA